MEAGGGGMLCTSCTAAVYQVVLLTEACPMPAAPLVLQGQKGQAEGIVSCTPDVWEQLLLRLLFPLSPCVL